MKTLMFSKIVQLKIQGVKKNLTIWKNYYKLYIHVTKLLLASIYHKRLVFLVFNKESMKKCLH